MPGKVCGASAFAEGPRWLKIVPILVAARAICRESSAKPRPLPPIHRNTPRWPGLQPDGQTLLFNQWSLRPAGKQIPLGIFPVNMAMHPRQPWAAVLHCGFGEHEIVIVDLTKQSSRFASEIAGGVLWDHV